MLYINISENQLVKKLNEMLYRKLFNDHNQTFLYRSPIVNEFGMRGSITDTHMGTWSGTQTPTIFYHLCGWYSIIFVAGTFTGTP